MPAFKGKCLTQMLSAHPSQFDYKFFRSSICYEHTKEFTDVLLPFAR